MRRLIYRPITMSFCYQGEKERATDSTEFTNEKLGARGMLTLLTIKQKQRLQ